MKLRAIEKSKGSKIQDEPCVLLHSNAGLTLPAELVELSEDPAFVAELDLTTDPSRGDWRAEAAKPMRYDWPDVIEHVELELNP